MLAMPMWLLFELGIVLARLIGKRPDNQIADAGAYQTPTEQLMNAELDRAESESKENRSNS
jgi:sec-independent protein translocase protein TatC